MMLLYVFLIVTYVLNQSFADPVLHQLTEPIDHGECPIWDPRTQLLYFVDVYEGRVLSYNPITRRSFAINLNGTVTPIIPSRVNPHLFVVAVDRSLFAIEWNGRGRLGATKNLTTVSQQFPTSRLNDGKADKKGRLWIGTMGYEGPTGVTPNEGILYLVTKDNLNNPSPVVEPVSISNGMAWNKANDKFYYIDTLTFSVIEYDYDNQYGKISNPRVVFNTTEHSEVGGFPDGMTIDKDDNLWIAINYAGKVVKVSSETGTVLQVINIPARDVTSVGWGGLFLNKLFVTTSRHSLTPEEQQQQPAAGSLFVIENLGTFGLPPFYTNIINKI